MKGFAQTGRAEHKAKFQQKFTLCPKWAEAESEIFKRSKILTTRENLKFYRNGFGGGGFVELEEFDFLETKW